MYRSYSGRPGKCHPNRIRPMRPRRVRPTSGSVRSSGSRGGGGDGRGRVVVRTPLAVDRATVDGRGLNSTLARV